MRHVAGLTATSRRSRACSAGCGQQAADSPGDEGRGGAPAAPRALAAAPGQLLGRGRRDQAGDVPHDHADDRRGGGGVHAAAARAAERLGRRRRCWSSADRSWAMPDIAADEAGASSRAARRSTTSRSRAGGPRSTSARRPATTGLTLGWAFDPTRPDTLRVVDRANRVWAVSVAGGKATQEGTLPRGPAGCSPAASTSNTGEPYMEEHRQRRDQPGGQRCRRHLGPWSRTTAAPSCRPKPAASPSCPQRPAASAPAFTDCQRRRPGRSARTKRTGATYYLPRTARSGRTLGKPTGRGGPRTRRRPARAPSAAEPKPVAARSIFSPVIDPRLLRDDPDRVRAAQAKRGLSGDVVDGALEADAAPAHGDRRLRAPARRAEAARQADPEGRRARRRPTCWPAPRPWPPT